MEVYVSVNNVLIVNEEMFVIIPLQMFTFSLPVAYS